MKLGVLECFFGSPWSAEDRFSYADFLEKNNFSFYIYAPKADHFLRKKWSQEWPETYLDELQLMATHFQDRGVKFGIGLSPMGIQDDFSGKKDLLIKRTKQLNGIGVDTLGIFFDDMPCTDHLAEQQLEVLDVVSRHGDAKLLFCPSYYSYDPILDQVFGQRPENYLEEIGRHLPAEIDIAWTGPKVISEEIGLEHLQAVTKTIQRTPLLCDNFFANDGPKNCKFLKIKALTGRSGGAPVSAWAFNPMNQPNLSKIVLLASKAVLLENAAPDIALTTALEILCGRVLAEKIEHYKTGFLELGLNASLEKLGHWQQEFSRQEDSFSREIFYWLTGKYSVGPECLTD